MFIQSVEGFLVKAIYYLRVWALLYIYTQIVTFNPAPLYWVSALTYLNDFLYQRGKKAQTYAAVEGTATFYERKFCVDQVTCVRFVFKLRR